MADADAEFFAFTEYCLNLFPR
ncbi:hypothetical protein CCACVL1_08486 [Corchorus capsularis]|uniref:Uncharacterized protein n=1 Tax=Corchorus capsularis TaxID=210143 RepID=A0A1R3HD46_COCAP|nr:hypothetical protein CCACVL1_20012 [Corchorus capsularis]OMO88284.1 hypothetical protein CCACVL1_08486 [Corchorus capsularis]